jgi:hypothetical protein
MKEVIKLINPKTKKNFYFLFFINIFISITEFISVASVYPLLITLTQETRPQAIVYIVNFFKVKESNIFVFFIITMLSFLLLKNISSIFANFIIQDFIYKNYNYIANGVIQKMLSASYLEMINIGSPTFIRNCKEIIFSARNYLMSKVFLYSEIVLIFALAILLLIVSPKLTVVSFIILFVFSFIWL